MPRPLPAHSFLTRQRLERAAIRAKEQAATVAYLILRAQALASANSIIDLVLAQVPALVAQRKSARKQAAIVRWACCALDWLAAAAGATCVPH